MITLITMGQGNPIALRRTLESFKPICNEVIFGDLLMFEEDRITIQKYEKEFNLLMVEYPFNYIFQHGFSMILNSLAQFANNDHVLYMNVSEVADGPLDITLDEGLYNCYFFNHKTDPHHWYRLYNRYEMRWGNLIHEELKGSPPRPCLIPSFTMADTEKDLDDPFKAKVYNDIKETVYFNQYLKLVDDPSSIQGTDQGWVAYARDGYESLKQRLEIKGKRYEAFKTGDYDMYVKDIYENPDFEKERMTSSDLINFQGDRKLL